MPKINANEAQGKICPVMSHRQAYCSGAQIECVGVKCMWWHTTDIGTDNLPYGYCGAIAHAHKL